jgi:hypothetical protein
MSVPIADDVGADDARFDRRPGGHRLALGLLAAVLLIWAAAMALALRGAALGEEAEGIMLAVFPPGTRGAAVLGAVAAADGTLIRSTGLGFVWVVHGPAPGFVGRLRQHGALVAYGEVPFAPSLGGCIVFAPRARGIEAVPGLDALRLDG